MKTKLAPAMPKPRKFPRPAAMPTVQVDLPELAGRIPPPTPAPAAAPGKTLARGGTAKELREAARPPLRQVAPGKFLPEPGRVVPEYVLSIATPMKDGTYEVRPMSGTLAKIEHPLLLALGMVDQVDTLYRLARAGFIEILRFTPQVSFLNLESLYGHLARVAEDNEFWEKRANLEAYRRALA